MEIQRSWRGLGSIRCIVERDDLAVFAFQLVINSGVVFVLYNHILFAPFAVPRLPSMPIESRICINSRGYNCFAPYKIHRNTLRAVALYRACSCRYGARWGY